MSTVPNASDRDPYDYTLEVCRVCGAQLDRVRNGRCPVDRAHWSAGGMVTRVLARPDSEQDRHYKPSVVPAKAKVASRG